MISTTKKELRYIMKCWSIFTSWRD